VLLDLVGPEPAESLEDATPKDWLDGFDWGEYFDPETFPNNYKPIEEDIESAINEVKELGQGVDTALDAAKTSD